MILAPVVIAAIALCAPAAASARLIYVAPDDESAGFLCTEAQPCALAIGINGVLDENQNFQVDAGERKLYFEVSDFATQYVFYESPR